MAGIANLKKEINAGKLKNLYVFIGEEEGMKDLYVKKLGTNIVRANSFKDIIPKLTSKTLFTQPKTYVIKEDKDVIKNNVDIASLIGKNRVIFSYGALDKRSKFYKAVKKHVYEFNRLTPAQLAGYICNEMGEWIDYELAMKVAVNCNNDFSRVQMEIDKLQRCGVRVTEDLINNLIYRQPEDVIFELIGCIVTGDTEMAYALYTDMMARGESPIKIISILYTNFKNTMLVQAMGNQATRDIAGATGLTIWHVNKAREKVGHYSLNNLLTVLRLIQGAEQGIKTGKIDQHVALDKLLIDILNLKEGN